MIEIKITAEELILLDGIIKSYYSRGGKQRRFQKFVSEEIKMIFKELNKDSPKSSDKNKEVKK